MTGMRETYAARSRSDKPHFRRSITPDFLPRGCQLEIRNCAARLYTELATFARLLFPPSSRARGETPELVDRRERTLREKQNDERGMSPGGKGRGMERERKWELGLPAASSSASKTDRVIRELH